MRGATIVALVITFAVGCGSRPTCPAMPTTGTARGPAFLWRAQKGDVVVWLFGTIHDAGLESVPRVALDVFDRALHVATELGDEPPDAELFRKYARVASGPGIDHLLPESDWYDLRDALHGKIKEDDLRRAAPWYAMSLLTTQSAPPGPSMDVLLVKRAQKRDAPIDALEPWEAQLRALSTTIVLADLQEAIHARSTMHCDHGRLRAVYDAGDIEAMTAMLVLPRTAESMLYARNRAWLPKLESYFTQGGAFVAVGLGHLLGEQGLPTLLAKAGYSVERVTGR